MAKFLLLRIDEPEQSGATGPGVGGGILLILLLIFLLNHENISSCIPKSKATSYNSEVLEKTIQDVNTLTNKEKITLEQCLVLLKFDRECRIDDNYNFIPNPLSWWPWAYCPGYLGSYKHDEENEIKKKCSTQKDKTYCFDNYHEICKMCYDYDHEDFKCSIEDNSLVYTYDETIPCSKELKSKLDKTIMAHCIELAIQKCHYMDRYRKFKDRGMDCRSPFWDGKLNDNDEKHFELYEPNKYEYQKWTGREL